MINENEAEQVKKAVLHALNQIRNKPEVGYYLGELTETFELLTEAAAILFGEPVEKVREFYRPQNPKKPHDQKERVRAKMWKDLCLNARCVLSAHAVGFATQVAIGDAEQSEGHALKDNG